jgi:phosphotransferase system, enzyme I, PtsP
MLESDTLIDGTLSRIRAGNWAPGALRETIAEHAGSSTTWTTPICASVLGCARSRPLHPDAPAEPDGGADPVPGPHHPGRRGAQRHADRRCPARDAGGDRLHHRIRLLARRHPGPRHGGAGGDGRRRPAGGAVEGRELVVDGYRGRVYVAPAPPCAPSTSDLPRTTGPDDELQTLRHLPAETTDGYLMPLYLNTGWSPSAPAGHRGVRGRRALSHRAALHRAR